MPDKKSSKNEDGDDAKGGGAKKAIISAVLCLGLLGGGYFLGGMMAGGDSAPVAEASDADTEAEEAEEVKEIGELVELEAVNVNLQEGHFLRVAVALEIHHDDEAKKKEAAADEPFPVAPAQDIVVATFSNRTMEELSSTEGREAARAELHEALVKTYGAKVYTVYLTQFVMQ